MATSGTPSRRHSSLPCARGSSPAAIFASGVRKLSPRMLNQPAALLMRVKRRALRSARAASGAPVACGVASGIAVILKGLSR